MLADDIDLLFVRSVGGVKVASSQDARAEGIEIARINAEHIRLVRSVPWQQRVEFHSKTARKIDSERRSGGPHTRQGVNALDNAPMELIGLTPSVAAGGGPDVDSRNVVGTETEIYGFQVAQRSGKQSGGEHNDKRQRDLYDDKSLP